MKTQHGIHPARGLLKHLALAAIALAAAFPGAARAETLDQWHFITATETWTSASGGDGVLSFGQLLIYSGGTLNQTGGTVQGVTNWGGPQVVDIGWSSGGTYNMSGYAIFTTTSDVYLNRDSGGASTWSLTDNASATFDKTLGFLSGANNKLLLSGAASLSAASLSGLDSAGEYISFASGSTAQLTVTGETLSSYTTKYNAGYIRVDGVAMTSGTFASNFQVTSEHTLSLLPPDPNALHHFAISTISTATAGTPISGVTITAQKANNETYSFTGTVTYSGTAGITGTSDNFVDGVLSSVIVPAPTLAGSDMTLIVTGSGKTGTSTFDVNPGAANKLAFGVQPSNTAPGAAISPAVTVKVQDAIGNTLNDTRSVTISSSTAALDGTSTFTVSAVAGVATFSNLKPTMLGSGHTLTASDGLLTPATSSSFTVAQPSDTLQWWYPSGTVTWTSTSGSYGNGLRTVTAEFNMGNGSYGAGTLNQTGGTITLQPGGSFGNGGYAGIYNMSGNACLISTTMSSGGNGTMTLTDNASAILSGALNFSSPGALFLSGAATFSAASLSGFNGANEYISFASASTATLTVANKVLADYQTMVTSGYIRVDGVAQSDFSRFQVTGSTLSLIREPAYILSFGLPGNPATIDHLNKTIAWTLPYGMSKTSLAPIYTLSSGICVPASNPSPALDFTNPVTYTVTDPATIPTTTIREYVVTVTVASPTGILVGSGGSGTLTFDTLPPADQWSTATLAGSTTDITIPAGLDAAVAGLTAGGITTALPTDTASSPGSNALARYNSNLKLLQSKPTGNSMKGLVLMATLRNISGSPINGLTISYDLGKLGTYTEEVPGLRAYYSLTGVANSWTVIPDLCTDTVGTLTANVTFSSPWAHASAMYVLWADDNGNTSDNAYTIDNASFAIYTPGGYPAWVLLYPGFTDTDPTHDPDGDGMTNQQEFAFGLDPTKGSSVSPITTGVDATNGQFSYTRFATSGLTYTVEYSTDLSGWNPAILSEPESVGAPDSHGVVTVTVKVSNPAVGGKLFVRVRAQ